MYVHHNTNHKQINVTIKYEIKLFIGCVSGNLITVRKVRNVIYFQFYNLPEISYNTVRARKTSKVNSFILL